MVAAVHFIATAEDHAAMLDYLGEPNAVTLHPWLLVRTPAETWTREQALTARPGQVTIVHREFGLATGLLNRLNWERLRPAADEGLVDSNASPVIFWELGLPAQGALHGSSLGSKRTRCRHSALTMSGG